MTRLNNTIKEAVIENAIEKSGINAQVKAIMNRRFQFAEAARIHALGGKSEAIKLEEMKAKIDKMLEDAPSNVKGAWSAIKTDNDILVNVSGLREYFFFDEKNSKKITPDTVVIQSGSQLADEFNAIHDEEQEVRDKRHNIVSTINAVFKKVGTVKHLIEVWPEAEELLPSDLSAAKNTLPAIRTEDLNAMIGLPTEK